MLEPDFDFIEHRSQAGLLARQVESLFEVNSPLGLDTETFGLRPDRDWVRLIQIGTADYSLIVDLGGFRADGVRQVDWTEPGLRELKALIESDKRKVLQNAAFDINFLAFEGVQVGGPVFDTMIAARIINNGSGAKNDLGSIASRVLGTELPKELQKADWSAEITPEMKAYAGRDTAVLPRLVNPLRDRLREEEVKAGVTLWDIFELEEQALRPIAQMQVNGFAFDMDKAIALRERLIQESDAGLLKFLDDLDGAIQSNHPDQPDIWLPREEDGTFNTREKTTGSVRLGTKKFAGFNPRSVTQMAQRFEQAGIYLAPNANGKPSLDQNLLAYIKDEYALVQAYLDWKSLVTRVSAVEQLIEVTNPWTGRIHGSYRQMGTETGRLSAASPNLQQIPRSEDFRSLFLAEPGKTLVVADFSQIELRVAAELSGEERMIEAYKAGRDLHTETAAIMAGVPFDEVTKAQRQSAKVANFGLLFGAGASTLRKQAIAQYKIQMTFEEAQDIVTNFREAYPTLYKWQITQGNMTTAAVFTKYGRRRILVGRNDKYTTRLNTQVQGTAGDISKIALIKIYEEIQEKPNSGAKLIATCHDEIVLEVPEAEALYWARALKSCMESAGNLICSKLPIIADVGVGVTWAEAKDADITSLDQGI